MPTVDENSKITEKEEKIPAVSLLMDMGYEYSAGEHFSFFFEKLKQKKIFGIQCPSCQLVYLPPRPFCGSCHVRTKTWKPVGPKGWVRAQSEVFLPILDPATGQNRKVPHTMVLVEFDGTQSCLHHVLLGEDKSQIGDRVEVVFAEQTSGAMKDLLGFRLCQSTSEQEVSLSSEAIDHLEVNVEPLTVEGRVRIPFSFTPGDVAVKFFSALEEKKLTALKCQQCGGVNLPPSKYCTSCFSPEQEWIEITPQGVVVGLVYLDQEHRRHLPDDVLGWALVKFEGLETSFLHHAVDPHLKVGDQVRLKYRGLPAEGLMLIKGFAKETGGNP